MSRQGARQLAAGRAPAPGQARRLAGLMGLTALALAVTLGWLASHAVPSTEAVRLRNSLIATVGSSADFDWPPSRPPAGFRQQRGAAPAALAEAARRAAGAGPTLERAMVLVRDLASGPEHGGPIQRSTLETWQVIRAAGGGYCADYTQVLNGLAWSAGIPVREWGVSFDGFGGFGHAFNEVYDEELGKWVMLDPFYAFYALDAASGMPLSAIEFRDRLRLPDPLASTTIVRLAPQAYDFSSDEKLVEFYRRGVDQFFLWWGNDVFDYDAHPAVRIAGAVSRGVEQLAAIALGVHPRIRILPTPGNATLVAALERTRASVLWLAAACLALLALLVVQWRLLRRTARTDGTA